MTVAELASVLASLPPDLPVRIQVGPETTTGILLSKVDYGEPIRIVAGEVAMIGVAVIANPEPMRS